MAYELELEKALSAVNSIKTKNPKVLIQLPDGLKPKAKEIVDFLTQSSKNKPEISIWLGSCFGACDLPPVKDKEFDLIIQWGHSAWK